MVEIGDRALGMATYHCWIVSPEASPTIRATHHPFIQYISSFSTSHMKLQEASQGQEKLDDTCWPNSGWEGSKGTAALTCCWGLSGEVRGGCSGVRIAGSRQEKGEGELLCKNSGMTWKTVMTEKSRQNWKSQKGHGSRVPDESREWT